MILGGMGYGAAVSFSMPAESVTPAVLSSFLMLAVRLPFAAIPGLVFANTFFSSTVIITMSHFILVPLGGVSLHYHELNVINVISFFLVGQFLYLFIHYERVHGWKYHAEADMQRSIVLATADIIESRDESTREHCKRAQEIVSDLIDAYSARYGLDKEYDRLIKDASPLYDIDKLRIKDFILLKPGPLTTEEREEMKAHATFGAQILLRGLGQQNENMEFCRIAVNIAAYHHERYDGKGYPKG